MNGKQSSRFSFGRLDAVSVKFPTKLVVEGGGVAVSTPALATLCTWINIFRSTGKKEISSIEHRQDEIRVILES